MKKLENRVAVITGSSRGIGYSISLAFASEGAKIVATARTKEALDALIAKISHTGSEAIAVPADLCLESDIQRIVDEALGKFGKIDTLVNNAAIIHQRVNLVEFDMTMWRQVLKVNLTAPALLIKAVLPNMMANKYGRIINISSIGGRKGGRGRSAYRASKAGLISVPLGDG